MSARQKAGILTAFSFWVVTVVGAAEYGIKQDYSGRGFVTTLVILASFLAIQLFLAAGDLGERFARRVGRERGILVALFPLFAYFIYLSGTGEFTWLRALIAASYTLAPVLIVLSDSTAKPGAWQDYAAMLAIFLPFKLGWLRILWPYPGSSIWYVGSILLATNVALGTFLLVRQLSGIGYRIIWNSDSARAISINFGLLALILIPLGTALHFIRFDVSIANWKSLPVDGIGILLLTAWPEEFLFRGLLQNTLSKRLSSDSLGLMVSSIIFGLAHIGNNNIFPNWKYALLATIAGFFYGRTWRKTSSIFSSAIVHGLVDTIWHLAFRTL
jgi:membrane protease YdiL (CAAX protease family)